MKINIKTHVLFMCVSAFTSMSCIANKLPEVKNATYQAYNVSGEAGYYVNFELSHDSIPATSLVINRIKQPISPDNKDGLKYNINVVSQSRKILGFKSKITDQENGLLFKIDTAEIFLPVDFKLQPK